MPGELLTTAEMGRADRLTIEGGTAGIVLMETAGRAVAEAARRAFPAARRVLVACGPGNNGGDGWVAARHLASAGLEVTVAALVPREALRGDAAEAAAGWTGPVAGLGEVAPDRADLVVDALFGAGLTREVSGAAAEFVNAVAAASVPVLSVDVPSGVDGTSGQVKGPAPMAALTVTFFRAKPGHYLYPGRAHVGDLEVADIGIPCDVLQTLLPRTRRNGPDLWRARFPVPCATGHKYGRGHAVVLSGAAHRTGAARLAARGALRIGAGLVTVASPRDALAANAAQLTAVMLAPCDTADELAALMADARHNALVAGPAAGVGETTRASIRAGLASEASMVVDADGLTSFAGCPADLFDAVVRRAAPVVLTPHEGEFGRLFPEIGAASKVERACRAAARSGAVVVLKGPDTVIAAPDGRAAINANAQAWLATAGSGDVLAGMVAGLLAQGLCGFDAAAAAVWLHGQAGRGPGLIAEDIPEALPGVLSNLLSTMEA